ncbi:MAG: hypothetical protein GYB68_11785 [Chloroflexi bacterium]|nr:hypothetical protein [Chloroflexota bacterium]
MNVYHPDGSFAGTLTTMGVSRRVDPGQIEVAVDNVVDGSDNPLQALTGRQHYLMSERDRGFDFEGPDLIGTSRFSEGNLRESILIHQTHVWQPRLGLTQRCEYVAFPGAGTVGYSEWQIAGQPIAYSTEAGRDGGPGWGGSVAEHWTGSVQRLAPSGEQVAKFSLTREYSGLSYVDWQDDTRLLHIELETWAPTLLVSGTTSGTGRAIGPILIVEAFLNPSTTLQMTEVLDTEAERLVSIRRWSERQRLVSIDLAVLSPQ